MKAPSAEMAALSRAPMGVSDEAMTGSWRVVIARTPERYIALYYHQNDDPRIANALHAQASDWLDAQLRVRK